MKVNLGKRSLDRISVDRNCVLSVDRNCGNQLIEFLDGFQLIESFNNDFGQTPKSCHLIESFINDSINCQNP